jgi:hypothetical protein
VATTTASNPKDVKDTATPVRPGRDSSCRWPPCASARRPTHSRAAQSQGYPAFIATAGAPGAPTYRVRVGKYPSRREADTVAAKLEREEQFKPWVTR